MKILELRFKNLNSLYGEWFIDFSAPEYISNGIFAITGPTGAGKSTIMDAICLALYGATPRLGRITVSDNEIMSRQTGECAAEVTFESQAGRFRCVWSQHRARKKADGKLAEPRHEISDALSGQIIEAQRRNVLRVIEDKTGMDFDRFTRSILLAQGGFASFLQAAPDERAPVLEQITGTAVYSEISRRVHERNREERELLARLQAEAAGMTLLSDEETAALTSDQENMTAEEKLLAVRNEKVKTSRQWLMTISGLQAEIVALESEQAAIHERLDRFKVDRERLRIALLAAELDGEYAKLSALRQQQQADQSALKACEIQLPQIQDALQQNLNLHSVAAASLKATRQEQQATALLLIKVRAIDQQIAGRQQSLDAALADLYKISADIASRRSGQEQTQAAQKNARAELAAIQAYLDDNARDAMLVSELTGIAGLVSQLTASVSESKDRETALAEALGKVVLLSGQSDSYQQSGQEQKARHDQVLTDLARARTAMADHLGGRLLREYHSDYEALLRERVFLQKIASLEDERQRLVDGQACPLCGATEHPFATGNTPALDEAEQQLEQLSALIETAGQLESEIKDYEDQEKKMADLLRQSDKILTEARYKKENAQAEADRLAALLTESDQRRQLYSDQLLTALQPLGLGDLAQTRLPAVLETLRQRQKNWLQNQQAKLDLQQKDQALALDSSRFLAIIATLELALKEKQAFVMQQQNLLSVQMSERSSLFGTKQPDDVEKELSARVDAAGMQEQHARDVLATAQQQAAANKIRTEALREAIEGRHAGLLQLEQQFTASLVQAGFASEAVFSAGRLPAPERSQLAAQAQDLDRQSADVTIRQKDRQARLKSEQDKKMSSEPLEQLTAEQAGLDLKLRELGEKIGAGKQKLLDNQAAQLRFKARQEAIEQQKNECRRWDKLHALIGSADGKKYRNFAQGLTFELMVTHANRQLAGMTDRYLLVCDSAQPLELNVIDNYQAGEIRSTKNLSGGESFIVSLALALGLSKMASRRVRVDSLFLDEGFGTLDEEALETALETLAGLHQDGKLIGIISHVPALKERISTRLTITPRSGGKSVITGPGVYSGDSRSASSERPS